MIDLSNYTDFVPKSVDIWDDITTKYTIRDIELMICDDSRMRDINLDTRGIDRATDVLSFPYDSTELDSIGVEHIPLGSIVISIDRAREKANELGHSIDDELTLLFTHGLLHILGYDHEKDDGEMRDQECQIITKFDLPKSLIVRTCIV